MNLERLSSSFRDPSGFVFKHEGVIYRQINRSYAEQYSSLMSSGLYESLVKKDWLIKHEEVDVTFASETSDADSYKVIKPEKIPYISYPYEWCFSQLKDAALLTLSIQAQALEHGLTLKDASAYNIQFVGSKPIFIDTLSFDHYVEGEPWVAYRQFCQHFLGPLAVMAYRDMRLRRLMSNFIDGLPIDLVSNLLPRRTYVKYSFLSHLHLHALSQKRHQDDGRNRGSIEKKPKMSKLMQSALVGSLRKAVDKCQLPKMTTEWGHYYEDTNYSTEGMTAKEKLVIDFIKSYVTTNETVHDIGGNTGEFSRLAAATGSYVLSHDIDELAVERNYLFNKEKNVENVLPLVLDLSNPSPALGWALTERDSVADRIREDVILALAIIHHIVISNNVPIEHVAQFFSRLAHTVIIEFVPKGDSQVERLLATREDIFPDYNIDYFEQAFGKYFDIQDKQKIEDTDRTLFVFKRK